MSTLLRNPVIRFEIDGKRQISDYFSKEEITLGEKVETIVTLNVNSTPSTSGFADVNIASMDIINKIIVNAPSLNTLNNTLRIIKEIDSVESIIDIEGISGLQILSFNDTEGAKIKKIQLKTDSEEDLVSFDCKILTV